MFHKFSKALLVLLLLSSSHCFGMQYELKSFQPLTKTHQAAVNASVSCLEEIAEKYDKENKWINLTKHIIYDGHTNTVHELFFDSQKKKIHV